MEKHPANSQCATVCRPPLKGQGAAGASRRNLLPLSILSGRNVNWVGGDRIGLLREFIFEGCAVSPESIMRGKNNAALPRAPPSPGNPHIFKKYLRGSRPYQDPTPLLSPAALLSPRPQPTLCSLFPPLSRHLLLPGPAPAHEGRIALRLLVTCSLSPFMKASVSTTSGLRSEK